MWRIIHRIFPLAIGFSLAVLAVVSAQEKVDIVNGPLAADYDAGTSSFSLNYNQTLIISGDYVYKNYVGSPAANVCRKLSDSQFEIVGLKGSKRTVTLYPDRCVITYDLQVQERYDSGGEIGLWLSPEAINEAKFRSEAKTFSFQGTDGSQITFDFAEGEGNSAPFSLWEMKTNSLVYSSGSKLKPGNKLKGTITINFKNMPTEKKTPAQTQAENIKGWTIVTPEKAEELAKSLFAGKIEKGNYLSNSSFELDPKVGWTFVRTSGTNTLSLNCSRYDGQKSCVFENVNSQAGLSGLIESLFFHIKPKHLYTLSFYARSGFFSPERLSVRVLSGHYSEKPMPSKYATWLTDRTGVSKEFEINGSNIWQRYSFSLVSGEEPKNYATILIEHTGGPCSVDCVQLEEGTLTDYCPKNDIEISGNLVTTDEGLNYEDYVLLEGETFGVNTTIYSRKSDFIPGQISLKVYDYYGKLVRDEKSSLTISPGRKMITREWQPFSFGLYRVIPEFLDEKGKLLARGQEFTFGVTNKYVQESPKRDDFFFAYTGHNDTFHGASKLGFNSWYYPRYMTWWEGIEQEPGKLEPDFRILGKGGEGRSGGLHEKRLWQTYNFKRVMGDLGWLPDWAAVIDKKDARYILDWPPPFPCGEKMLEPWRNYIRNMVSCWKDRIKMWEIGNENYCVMSISPEAYVRALKIAYETIKEIDPTALVIAPSTYYLPGYHREWTEKFFKAGGGKYFDIFSYHAYWRGGLPTENDWPLDERLELYRELMRKYGEEKPMMDSESGWNMHTFYTDRIDGGTGIWILSHPNGDPNDLDPVRYPSRYNYRVSTAWITQGVIVGLAHGVKHFVSWSNGFYPFVVCLNTNFAPFEYDGAPKPMGMAIAAMADILTGAEFVQEAKIGSQAKCYVFKSRTNESIACLWGIFKDASGLPLPYLQDPEPHFLSVNLGESRFQLRNPVGGPITAKTSGGQTRLELGRDVLYLITPISSQALVTAMEKGTLQANVSIDGLSAATKDNRTVVLRVLNGTAETITGKIYDPVTKKPIGKFKAMPDGLTIVRQIGFTKDQDPKITRVAVELSNDQTNDLELKVKKTCLAQQGTIRIDGKPDDWVGKLDAAISDVNQVSENPGNWTGAVDNSGLAGIQGDTDNIYLGIEVTDDSVVTSDDDNAVYSGDSVEFFLNPWLLEPRQKEAYIFFASPPDSKHPARWGCPYSQVRTEEMKVAASATPTGYFIEMAIPLSVLNAKGWNLQKGTWLGFDVNINDKDRRENTSRKHVMTWNGTVENSIKPELYGIAIF